MQSTRDSSLPRLLPEVEPVRAASRRIVRELGFLQAGIARCGVSHSQCHALLELDRGCVVTTREMAHLLNLDKSTLCRALLPLRKEGYVTVRSSARDGREAPLALTPSGRRLVGKIHEIARRRVQRALGSLPQAERSSVVRGLSLYGRALARARAEEEFTLREIRPADDRAVGTLLRRVMAEYGCTGPGFAVHDPEVAKISQAYERARHAYLVLVRRGRIVGGAGFGPLAGGDRGVCELRKMYFLPEARGLGLGRSTLEQVMERARREGFRRIYLETLASMTEARRLYESAGFRRLARPLGNTGHFGCDAWYGRDLTKSAR